MKIVKKISLAILLSAGIASQANAVEIEGMSDKDFACSGLKGERFELEHSLAFAKEKGLTKEKVLVEFGTKMAFMTANQGVSYYNERIRHIKTLEKVLDCDSGFGKAQKVSVLN